MAREAYRSIYGDLTKLKDDAALKDPAAGTGDDTELFQLLLATSVQIDRLCNRPFFSLTETRTFDGPGSTRLIVPDLIAITSLKADEDDDQTFEVTWATSDYFLEPYNAAPTAHYGSPYTSLLARANGDKQSFLDGQQKYEIAGKWGYSEVLEDSGSKVDDAGGFNVSDPTFGVDDGTDFAIGQTILIDTEQMLITDISSNNLTVVRGLNGTTAAAQADNATVSIVRWPAPIERAAVIQAARIWTRAADFEPFYVDADLDTDVRLMIDPYRLVAV